MTRLETYDPARDERGRARGFVVVTAVLGLFLVAAAAPSPLYGFYAARWHFGPVDLTAVFAVYAVSLLLALLLAGSLSDSVGRRPVVLVALGLLALAMVLFLLADGLGWLYVARVVQGSATGLATAALAAAPLDLQPASRPGLGPLVNAITPSLGLAAGALGAGALVQYAPSPTRLVYAVLLVGCAALALALLRVPETVTARRRHVVTVRLGVAPSVRPTFVAALPCLIATWALAGLYLSLGPSIALALLQSSNRLAGGAAVAALTGASGLASWAVRAWPPRTSMLRGCAALAAGAVVTVVGIASSSPTGFFVGSTVAGLGFGAAFFGAFRLLAGLAAPERRGELVSAVYFASYVGFSLPAVLAGVASAHVGLHDTSIAYASVVAALSVLAIAATARTTSA